MGELIKLSIGNEVNMTNLAIDDGSVRVTTDTRSLFFELDGARLEITDFVAVTDKAALEDILTPIAKKFYFVESENTVYKYDAATSSWKALVSKLDPTDIVDDLTSTDATKVLSANQGRQLQENIDNLIWSGTIAEYEAALAAGEIKPGQLVNITDDTDVVIIDNTVTADSNNPVSSKAVYNALELKVDTEDITTTVSAHNTDEQIPTALAVYTALTNHLDSPELTGVPKAPTATEGTNTTQIATTEFVMTAINAVLSRMVTSLSAESTDDEIPTAKAVWDRISELQEAMQGMMGEYTVGEETTDETTENTEEV